MGLRVIESISEREDTQDVRNEWDWLVEPLASVITFPVDHSPEELYFDTKEPCDFYGFPALSDCSFYDLPGDWESRYKLITDNSRLPHVLIGDIGVGKTSWIARFLHYLKSRKDVTFVYYDHHKERGRPDGRHLENDVRLHCQITGLLVRCIQGACDKNAMTTHSICKCNIDTIARDPGEILPSTTEIMRQACDELFSKKNHRVFLIVDNLDEYDRSLQEVAISFADHVSLWNGVSSIVSLRPETYHFTQNRLGQPRHLAIYPSSLEGILRQRLNYLWGNGGSSKVEAVIERFRTNGLSLNILWSREVIDYNPGTLRRLHERIVDVLTENRILDEALQRLHNFNMREILAILSRLLKSGFFSELMIGRLQAENTGGNYMSTKGEAIITTYLRGPYLRYRGWTYDYPSKYLNIFDIPGVANEHALVGVRILQLLGKSGTTGEKVARLREVIVGIGYPVSAIENAILLLAKWGFIIDINEQKAWHLMRGLTVVDSDQFALASAGNYLLTKFLSQFAFRYCEAMADVTSRSRLDDQAWSRDRSYDSLVFNALGICDLIIFAAESEIVNFMSLAGPSKQIRRKELKRFKEEFYGPDVLGRDFLTKVTRLCYYRSKTLSKYAYDRYSNFDGQSRLNSYISRMEALCVRARNIVTGTSFI